MVTKKVLIITYYWPPSGGAGVQRWLKLTKYMAEIGCEIHVLTVQSEKAGYLTEDESLMKDVHPKIRLYKTNSWEPIKIYSKIVGKSNVPTAGFSNVNNEKKSQKIAAKIRSRFFVPDPRIGWNRFALKKATEIILENKINTVITTSPPHSSQLIGLRLKEEMGNKVNWIADFRDPWTDIYYYHLLQHSKKSHAKNLKMEREVLEKSDQIITVGEKFKKSFLSKTNLISSDKIKVISNGFDKEDFKNAADFPSSEKEFVISYTGTMSEKYEPEVFFEVLEKIISEYPTLSIRFQAVGVMTESIREKIISHLGEKASFFPPVSHSKAIQFMLESNLLLLVTQGEDGTIPGKTFEYLASYRRIIGIGKGDSAEVIERCQAGKSFERNEKTEIYDFLKNRMEDFINKKLFSPNTDEIEKLSSQHNAQKVMELLS